MPEFKVTIMEVVTTYRSKVFTAETEDDAREQAEQDDWREWELTYDSADCGIDEVERIQS